MNSLEALLHFWQPRHPSAGLRRRIFGERVGFMPKMAWFVGWLVPATACALLTVSVFNSGNNISGRSARREGLVAAVLSNQSFLASVPETFQKGQNDLSFVTFDWTNRSGFTSSVPFFSSSPTN
jgi:hypothetical protein